MYVKYILFLCLTCYISTVNSDSILHSVKFIDKEEIEILWESIALHRLHQIIEHGDMYRSCGDVDANEIINIFEDYGKSFWIAKEELGYRMSYYHFQRAANDGRIQRWPTQVMYAEFKEINQDISNRKYITQKDMAEYYGKRMTSPKINAILRKYGKNHDGQLGLDFFQYKIAANIGHLPAPFHDKIATMYTAFNKISPGGDYLTKNTLIKMYRNRISKSKINEIVAKYGEVHCLTHGRHVTFLGESDCKNIQYRVYFFHFRNLLTSGKVSVLNELIENQVIMPIVNPIDEKEYKLLWRTLCLDKEYLTFDDFLRTYGEENLNEYLSIFNTYGQLFHNEKVIPEYRIYDRNFRRAVLDGRINRWSKQVLHNVFKNIIPKKKNRNYIIYNDMVLYYGENIPAVYIRSIMKVFGKLTDGVYQLSFDNFRRAINIGHVLKPSLESCCQTIGELYNVFKEITPQQYVTSSDLITFYGNRYPASKIESTVKSYGKLHDEKDYMLSFDTLRKAWHSRELPSPIFSENVTEEEIESLYNAIRGKSEFITFDDLKRNYPDEDEKTHMNVLNKFGFKFEKNEDNVELRMELEEFRKAMLDGRISRWPLQAVRALFKEIIPEKDTMHFSDMVKYYGKRIELRTVLYNFGVPRDDDYALNYNGFKRVIALGLVPGPPSDKISEMYQVFSKIIRDEEGRIYITKEDLIECYGTKLSESQIDNIIEKYGQSTEPNQIHFNDFRNALASGDIPKPSFAENEIHTEPFNSDNELKIENSDNKLNIEKQDNELKIENTDNELKIEKSDNELKIQDPDDKLNIENPDNELKIEKQDNEFKTENSDNELKIETPENDNQN